MCVHFWFWNQFEPTNEELAIRLSPQRAWHKSVKSRRVISTSGPRLREPMSQRRAEVYTCTPACAAFATSSNHHLILRPVHLTTSQEHISCPVALRNFPWTSKHAFVIVSHPNTIPPQYNAPVAPYFNKSFGCCSTVIFVYSIQINTKLLCSSLRAFGKLGPDCFAAVWQRTNGVHIIRISSRVASRARIKPSPAQRCRPGQGERGNVL